MPGRLGDVGGDAVMQFAFPSFLTVRFMVYRCPLGSSCALGLGTPRYPAPDTASGITSPMRIFWSWIGLGLILVQ